MKRFVHICLLAVPVAAFVLNSGRGSAQPQSTAPAPAVGQSAGNATPSGNLGGSGTVDSNDPLLQPPPLPPGKATLVGGRVIKVDRVKQELSLRPFGGGHYVIHFDERTHIYRDGVETTQAGMRKGDRVYVDTLTDGGHVLAKNIRVQTLAQTADARGQLLGYRNGRLQLRDQLTAEPISFDLTKETVIWGSGAGSAADLLPGALVQVRFAPTSPDHWTAQEVVVLAKPGSSFVFAGKVTHIDMRAGTLAVMNRVDSQSYDVSFSPGEREYEQVGVGTEVTLKAVFDGAHYRAQQLSVDSSSQD